MLEEKTTALERYSSYGGENRKKRIECIIRGQCERPSNAIRLSFIYLLRDIHNDYPLSVSTMIISLHSRVPSHTKVCQVPS